MDVNVRNFLGYSYNHGYITIKNNKGIGDTLWEGHFETIDHFIPEYIALSNVVKWGIENNGIVIYINKEVE